MKVRFARQGVPAHPNAGRWSLLKGMMLGVLLMGSTWFNNIHAQPNITQCSPDTVVLSSTDPGNCSGVLGDYRSLLQFTSNDPGVAVTQDPAPGTLVLGPHNNATQVQIIVTETSGAADTCTLQVIFLDDEVPQITCPANITIQCGESLDPVNTGQASAIDDCQASLTYNTSYDPSTGCTCITKNGLVTGLVGTGTYTREWIATDAAGQADTCYQTIFVWDSLPPVISRGSIPARMDTFCTMTDYQLNGLFPTVASWRAAGGIVYDTCANGGNALDPASWMWSTQTINNNQPPNSICPQIVRTTYLVRDSCDNVDSAWVEVVIGDFEPPFWVSFPPDDTVECDEPLHPVARGMADASDNCAPYGGFYLTWSDASTKDPDPANCGHYNYTLTRTWTATDTCSNSISRTQTIYVRDREAPQLTLPADVTTPNDPGECRAWVSLTQATATDNCSNAVIDNSYTSGGADASGYYPVGTTLVVFTATDVCQNIGYDTLWVTVQDQELPQVACVAPFNVYLDTAGLAHILTSDVDNGSTDNCGIDTMYLDRYDFSCLDVNNTYTITLTAVDLYNNTAQCTTSVTVLDTLPPVPVCTTPNGGMYEVFLDMMGMGSLDPADLGSDSYDNCTLVGVWASKTDFDCHDLTVGHTGPIPVTLTAQDQSGNTDSTVCLVYVRDTLAPWITCVAPAPVTNLPGQCEGIVTLPGPPTGDNCYVKTVKNNYTSLTVLTDTFPVGTTVVTWTVIDRVGNMSTCQVQVVVDDAEGPMAKCQDVTTYLDASGNASITAADIDGGSVDNCGLVALSAYPTSFTCADRGAPVQVTLTVTDVASNMASCTADVTVLDTLPPTAVCQDVTVYLDASGNGATTVAEIDGGSTDNCGAISNRSISRSQFSCADIPGAQVVLTVEDDNNPALVGTCMADVTVLDTVKPTALCRSNVDIYLDQVGQVVLTPDSIDFGSYDACGLVRRTVIPAVFDCDDRYEKAGAHFATLEVEDPSGNISTCTTQVRVYDFSDPLASCKNLTLELDSAGQASITAADVDNGSTDNCGIEWTYISRSNFDCTYQGLNIVNLVVADSSGNLGICTSTVLVVDAMDPVAKAKDLTVYLDALGNATVRAADIDNGTSDNCFYTLNIRRITSQTGSNQIAFDCNDPASNPHAVILTATDIAGNTGMDTAYVTVLDTLSPVIQASGQTVCNDPGGCEASLTVQASASDNCSIGMSSYSISLNPINGSPSTSMGAGLDASGLYPVGSHTVTFMAEDVNGNSTSETITITVNDCQAPVIGSMPADQQLNNVPGDCYQTTSWSLPVVNENCCLQSLVATSSDPNVIITQNGNMTGAFATFPVGTTTIYYTATDCAGLTAVDSFTVTVIDAEPPSISCVPNKTVSNDPGVCGANVTWNEALIFGSAQDNCFVDTVISTHSSGDFFPLGNTTVTYTVIDRAGNQDTCSFVVTVNDTQAPVISCPADITIPQDVSLYPVCGAVVNFMDATATDNCSMATVMQSGGQASGTTFPVGTSTVSFTAMDAFGNLSMCSFNITVVPEPPLASIQNNGPVDLCGASAQLLLSANTPASWASGQWSATGPGTVTFSPSANDPTVTATFSAAGVHQVIWTASNSCGTAQASDSLQVTIFDAPVIDSISVMPPSAIGTSDGEATAHVTGGLPPYSYLWSDGQTTPTAIGLAAGTYSVVVTDSLGCFATDTVTISGPTLVRVCKLIDWQRMNGYAVRFNPSSGSLTPTSSKFSWVDSAMVMEYSNGDVNITGTLVDTIYQPQGGSFDVDIWLTGPRNWTQWQNLGGTYTGPPGMVGNPYINWVFYLLDGPRSTMVGQGIFAGDTLFLSHNPAVTGSNDKAWQLGLGANQNNNVRGLSGGFAYTSASGLFSGTGMMSGNLVDCRSVPFIVQVQPIVMLEGAYDSLANSMTDILRTRNLLPTTEPYTGIGYQHIGGGGETLNPTVLFVSGNDAVVDWVVVELRHKQDPKRIVATRSALLQRDGDVVDVDGISDVTFYNVVPDHYYVVVRHRNHLGTMTGESLDLFTNLTMTVDFTDPQTAIYGSGSHKLVVNGRSLMFGGDADFNGQIQNSDDVYLWIPQSGTAGYNGGDYNLDGQVQNTDRQYIWLNNSGRGDDIPE